MDRGDFNRSYDEGESVVLDPSTSHSAGPPSLPGKDKRYSLLQGCSCSSQPSQGRTKEIVSP